VLYGIFLDEFLLYPYNNRSIIGGQENSHNSGRNDSVYFIKCYIVTVCLSQVFKMAAFGLDTQSGPFSDGM
jgi:hypothetical protein